MTEIEFLPWSIWGKACVFPTRPHHLISHKHDIIIWSWLTSLTSFPTFALYPVVTLIVSSFLRHSSFFFFFISISCSYWSFFECWNASTHLVTSLSSLKITDHLSEETILNFPTQNLLPECPQDLAHTSITARVI